jgi:antitoxin (DNA-binding transcriptional repressor) of toxin-antitoxin stability system
LVTAQKGHQADLMAISVTQFRAHCLELIRQVEAGGEEVQISRIGVPPADHPP